MRNTQLITITDEGRDKGKLFVITEMPATHGERWAMRAFFILAKAGVEIPDDVAKSGMAGLAAIGLQQLFKETKFEDVTPLLDELMGCVRIVRDHSHPEMTFPLMEEDTEEIQTRMLLRAEAFKLHVGFLKAAAQPPKLI